MAGLPYAGKSYVINLIADAIPEKECLVISPKSFREDNYESLNEDAKREMNIAVWEVSLDYLGGIILKNKNQDLIFYDTACSSLCGMELYFQSAKRNGHKILYVFVHADVETCKARGAPIKDEIFQRYNIAFSESIEPLINMSDAHVVVMNNDESIPDVAKIVGLIRKLGNND